MPPPGAIPPRFVRGDAVPPLLTALGDDFAVLPGPPHAFPPYEIVPLAPSRARLDGWPEAVLLDMDGTLTSTEPLCLRALEEVLRLAAGHEEDPDWRGLDPERDYPRLIGNSTSAHVAYVLETYADAVKPEALRRHALEAALWGLTTPWRYEQCQESLVAYGLFHELREFAGDQLAAMTDRDSTEGAKLREAFARQRAKAVPIDMPALRTRAGVDIYYRWWHGTLARWMSPEGRQEHEGEPAIEPMPGVGAFLALTQGWLGEEAGHLAPMLNEHLETAMELDAARDRLTTLGLAFAEKPVRLAVVTAAELFEAESCLTIALEHLRREVNAWPVSMACRRQIRAGLKDLDHLFAALITATDSTEHRLKPHRDLYTLVLQRLGITPEDCGRVMGIEDSYAGVTALRAAGIGLAVAVPFEHSGSQDYSAAAHVIKGGLPALILEHGLFLPESK